MASALSCRMAVLGEDSTTMAGGIAEKSPKIQFFVHATKNWYPCASPISIGIGGGGGGKLIARKISNPPTMTLKMNQKIEVNEEEFEKNQQAFSDVLARYYGDPDFRAKLEADPTSVLKEAGVNIPENTTVELLFNTTKLVHIVLPYLEGEKV
ncbi:MAG: hypothetical protein ACR2P7_01980 [bacterium]